MKKITKEQYEDIRQDLAGDFSSPCVNYEDLPDAKPDFLYESIEEFENIVGYKVNQAFKDGWRIARTTNNKKKI